MKDADHTRVLNLVRRAVVTSPELGSREIHQLAAQRYPWVKELDLRQFSARFIRKARREAGGAPPQARSPSERGGARLERPRPGGASPVQAEPNASGSGNDGRSGHRPVVRRETDRALVRRASVAFAQELVSAKSDRDVVEMIRRVDAYVDRALEA